MADLKKIKVRMTLANIRTGATDEEIEELLENEWEDWVWGRIKGGPKFIGNAPM